MLVLPAHIRVKDWVHALGHRPKHHPEHFLLLLHIWRAGDSPGHDFLCRKVGICQDTSKKLVRSLFIPEEPQQGLCPYASLPQDIFLT